MQTRIRKAYIVISVLVLVWILSLFIKPVISGNGWTSFILCQIFHANIFHLLANCFVLNNIRFNWKEFTIALIIGSLAMTTSIEPTLGISAVIYVLIAFRMMETHLSLKSWVSFLVINGITAFIPHIAFRVHMASFVMGVIFVLLKCLNRRINEYRRIA